MDKWKDLAVSCKTKTEARKLAFILQKLGVHKGNGESFTEKDWNEYGSDTVFYLGIGTYGPKPVGMADFKVIDLKTLEKEIIYG